MFDFNHLLNAKVEQFLPFFSTTNFDIYNIIWTLKTGLLSMPMGVDCKVIGFDMEVQPLVIHNAA